MLQTDSCFNWRNTYSGETKIFDDDADYHGDGDDDFEAFQGKRYGPLDFLAAGLMCLGLILFLLADIEVSIIIIMENDYYYDDDDRLQ